MMVLTQLKTIRRMSSTNTPTKRIHSCLWVFTVTTTSKQQQIKKISYLFWNSVNMLHTHTHTHTHRERERHSQHILLTFISERKEGRTIQISKKETRCSNMGYDFRLADIGDIYIYIYNDVVSTFY